MDKPFMVKQTITYSDGTETVINYVDNPERYEIEKKVAAAVEENHPTDVVEDEEETVFDEE